MRRGISGRKRDRDNEVGGDKAQGGEALFLHRLGDQEAQRLLGVASGETVDDKVFMAILGEAFHKQPVGFGQSAEIALQGEPLGGVAG